MGVSPASSTIRALDEWQISLMYEVAMNYPIEGLRKSYYDRKKSIEQVPDEEFLDLGYTLEEIAQMKGKA